MFPISYTTDAKGKITFHYDEEDYKQWCQHHGGQVLVSIDGLFYMYWVWYGDIKYTITIKHFPPFDGPVQPPEYYLKEQAEARQRAFWNNAHSQPLIP